MAIDIQWNLLNAPSPLQRYNEGVDVRRQREQQDNLLRRQAASDERLARQDQRETVVQGREDAEYETTKRDGDRERATKAIAILGRVTAKVTTPEQWEAVKADPQLKAMLPPEMDPGALDFGRLQKIQEIAAAMQGPDKLTPVSAGDSLYNPRTGKTEFTAPNKAVPLKPDWRERKLADGSSEFFDINAEGGAAQPAPAPSGATSPPRPSAPGSNAPRGLRNNNPLNLRPLGQGQWNGQTGVDGGNYAQFGSEQDGWNAAHKNLETYGSKHGINTVAGVISRWAPSGDNNNPQSYAATVAKKLGVNPNATINLSDASTREKLLSAMADVELGQDYNGPGGAPTAPAAPANPRTIRGDAKPAPKAEDTIRRLSPSEASAQGLDPTGVYQIDGKGRVTTVDKTTEAEKKNAAYTYRVLAANDRMNGLANKGIFKPTALELVADKNGVSRLVIRNANDRAFVQASKEWLAPILRKDTGAAVTDSELMTYADIFIPRPEDDVNTLRQKAQARHDAMKALAGEAGRAYGTYGKRTYNVVMPGKAQPKATASKAGGWKVVGVR